jgi:hypothetical protein
MALISILFKGYFLLALIAGWTGDPLEPQAARAVASGGNHRSVHTGTSTAEVRQGELQ